MILRAIRFGAILGVVQVMLWLCNPVLLPASGLQKLWKMLNFLYFQMLLKATTTAAQLLCWWHDGPHPSRPPYIPKRIRRWKRLPEQYCQLLKSWTHTFIKLFTWTKVSASERLTELHHKLQGVIFVLNNSRRVHMRKTLALKHRSQNFSRPRVKFRKHQHVFPLLCLNALIVSPVAAHPSHDGVQVKAAFDTDSLDFGIDNRCSACISNVKEHFVGDLEKTNKVIKGYGGTRTYNVWCGTMRLPIEDDNGRVETFLKTHIPHPP